MTSFKHGWARTPTYNSWTSMRGRCDSPRHDRYQDYGGRGITYDSRWGHFGNFFADMGERPEGTSLDRYPDKDGNYCKENCRWATPEQQSRNTRTFTGTSPCPGVHHRGNGHWRAQTKRHQGKITILYTGPNINEAIEARQFYESFILGD